MKKISTPYLSSIKGTPFLVVTFLAVTVGLMLVNRVYETNPLLLLLPCGMAVVGYYFGKRNAQDLADEVYDCGDSLLVRKSGEEDRIALANIVNLNFSAEPSRITLTLDPPRKFGDYVRFAPPPQVYWGPNPENPIAQDLVMRAGQARKSRCS
ncbi:MAG TPA: hypothetical protein VK466_00650 [Terriglobales bacterium]|nr:hypothetical protein [Terriglobales bacterium]